MSENLGMTVGGLITVAVNYILLFMIFPCRYNKRLSITITILFTAIYYYFLYSSGMASTVLGGFRGLVHLPLIIVLFHGQFFQKTFAAFLVMLVNGLLINPVRLIVRTLAPVGSAEYYMYLILLLLIIYIIYIVIMLMFGRNFFEKLFVNGRRIEWSIYSLGMLFSFFVMAIIKKAPIDTWTHMTLLVFIFWGLIILCFAIINTHEKTKRRLDAEFAKDIVSSGRDHYQKMDELYDKLRMLHHDYKYHLNAALKMLASGNLDEADQYLTDVENQLSEHELKSYCSNSVINALIAVYVERCAKLNIKFNVDLVIPEPISVRDYDMCIVLGNLLENAVEACEKQKSDRNGELIVKPQGTQLVIVMRNSFDGRIIQKAGTPVSMKKDGGLGLRSVRAVAARYGGELLVEWDETTFTAYVYI